jgi:hypothetical protein
MNQYFDYSKNTVDLSGSTLSHCPPIPQNTGPFLEERIDSRTAILVQTNKVTLGKAKSFDIVYNQ